jgi:hypothetical protein
MKGILEFDLPEEQEDFDLACKASSLQCTIEEIQDLLRKYDKYGLGEDKQKLSSEELVSVLRQEIIQIILEREVG